MDCASAMKGKIMLWTDKDEPITGKETTTTSTDGTFTVVRCKDCKYYDSHHPFPVCNYHEDNVKETDYCSWGERKE